MKSPIRLAAVLLVALLVASAPWCAQMVCAGSTRSALIQDRVVGAGELAAASGASISIYLALGDIFSPHKLAPDIGFDVVALSLFFDPLKIDGAEVLPANPLLVSALIWSSHDEDQYRKLLEGVAAAVDGSREPVRCLSSPPHQKVCEGDQIRPFIWPVVLREGSREV